MNRSDTNAPLGAGALVVQPTLGGKAIKVTKSFKAGKVRLSFLVPKKTKGKLFRVKIKVTASGQTATRLFTYKVH